MKQILICVLLSSLLSGCSLFQRKEVAIIPPTKTVQVDPRSLQSCNKLPAVDIPTIYLDKELAYTYLLENLGAILKEYQACYNKQENSIKLLKKYGEGSDKIKDVSK